MPRRPSPIVSINWLVEEIMTKLSGKSLSLHSLIWLDDIRIEPSLATKYSQVDRKNGAEPDFVKWRLKPLNLS